MNKLEIGKVVKIESFSEGKRVLIDFMDNFTEKDYVLVGNTMVGFLPLVSESHESENYMPRTFRFNLGAIHQYIMTDDNNVRYIDELSSGDYVTVFVGNTVNKFCIGRVKKEIRKFTKLSVDYNGKVISAILQDGETTAILTPNGIRHIKQLSENDDVFVLPWGNATHLGNVIEEYVEEY